MTTKVRGRYRIGFVNLTSHAVDDWGDMRCRGKAPKNLRVTETPFEPGAITACKNCAQKVRKEQR